METKVIKLGKDCAVIPARSYSTEKDQKQAIKDIERVLSIIADMSFVEICKLLEPYRIKNAKAYDKEVEQENKENKRRRQFTGLSDKNGTKIREGDILAIDEYSTFESTGKGIVELYNGKFVSFYGQDACSRDCYDDLYAVCKERIVVGNIYDNPELLEANND